VTENAPFLLDTINPNPIYQPNFGARRYLIREAEEEFEEGQTTVETTQSVASACRST
jgi:hypothetical protein